MARALSLTQTPGSSPLSWHFQPLADAVEYSNPVLRATAGEGWLHVGARIVWGRSVARATPGVEWEWSDLLESLTLNWRYLVYEGGPHGLPAASAAEAREKLEAEWAKGLRFGTLSEDEVEQLDLELHGWEERHDLSRFLGGLILPSVYVARQGNQIAVVTSYYREECVAAADVVKAELQAIGDRIAGLLSGLEDERATALLEAWERREPPASDKWASIATGMAPEVLEHARGDLSEAMAWGSGTNVIAETHYLLAARAAAGQVGRHSLGVIFAEVRAAMNFLAEDRRTLQDADEPYEGATAVDVEEERALALRGELEDLDEVEPALPGKALDAIDCLVKKVVFDEATFPGLVVAAPGKRAAVIVNAGYFGPDKVEEYRFALAHALGRLTSPESVGAALAFPLKAAPTGAAEDAFALEYLVPSMAAKDAMPARDVDGAVVEELAERFGVSMAVAATKLWEVLGNRVHSSQQLSEVIGRHAVRSADPPAGPRHLRKVAV